MLIHNDDINGRENAIDTHSRQITLRGHCISGNCGGGSSVADCSGCGDTDLEVLLPVSSSGKGLV